MARFRDTRLQKATNLENGPHGPNLGGMRFGNASLDNEKANSGYPVQYTLWCRPCCCRIPHANLIGLILRRCLGHDSINLGGSGVSWSDDIKH